MKKVDLRENYSPFSLFQWKFQWEKNFSINWCFIIKQSMRMLEFVVDYNHFQDHKHIKKVSMLKSFNLTFLSISYIHMIELNLNLSFFLFVQHYYRRLRRCVCVNDIDTRSYSLAPIASLLSLGTVPLNFVFKFHWFDGHWIMILIP